ncbi:leucine-rich alpha-2-glycoprotein [Tiliqua scincoides]|uniref:leucine-rich alpha-2-glycoprotein n=1 Tax=Tiliqua scincoides TaxID=71010 RepID=UPI003462A302
MDRLVLTIFHTCLVMVLHCCCLQASPCPPVPTPNNITEFSCSSLSLSDFPSGFPKETRIISVEFTNISSIDVDALQGLPNLQELHLSNNKLRTLPSGLFRSLPELHTLDLTGNFLEDLPVEIFEKATGLRQLALTGNRLSTLRPSWFQPLRHLEFLDLSNNQLEDVPQSCFNKLENLTSLQLSQNSLRTLSPQMLDGILHLEKLDLEGNQLQSIENNTFQAVPHVKFIFLQNNSLTNIPAGLFKPLDHLELLDVSSNQLTTWDPQFSTKVTTLSLDLSRNPWACDCHILSLLNELKHPSISLYSKQETLCATPKSFQGQLLTSVDVTKFSSCSILKLLPQSEKGSHPPVPGGPN